MRRFTNAFLIYALPGILILSSCGKEEETSIPQDNSWYEGYFEGTISGKEISVKNVGHGEWPVRSVGKSFRDSNEEPDSIKGLTTEIKYSENEVLSINLYHLKEGTRDIINSTRVDWIYDGIQIQRDMHSPNYDTRYILYIPKKEKPFRVKVTNATYVDNTHPIVEAELDGVLYRPDNPKDSIIVKGSYGTRI